MLWWRASSNITVSGKSTRPNIVDLGRWRGLTTVLVSLFSIIVIIIPFITIATTSVKKNLGKGLFEANNFTTMHWTKIFGRDDIIESLINSITFAAAAATIGIVISFTMAYLLQRTRVKGRKIPDFLITLGSGTPSVVIALGLIMTMNGKFGINLYNTAAIMIIAYLIKYLMMGIAHGGIGHEPDPCIPGGELPGVRRGMAAHDVQGHHSADFPLHRGGLVPDLHSLLL